MKEKRMNALWQPHLWSGLLRVQCAPHYPIPNGTVVWVQIPQGRYLVQTALKQGRVHRMRRSLAGTLFKPCHTCANWSRNGFCHYVELPMPIRTSRTSSCELHMQTVGKG